MIGVDSCILDMPLGINLYLWFDAVMMLGGIYKSIDVALSHEIDLFLDLHYDLILGMSPSGVFWRKQTEVGDSWHHFQRAWALSNSSKCAEMSKTPLPSSGGFRLKTGKFDGS